MCRWHVATAVAFPQKRNPTFSAKWQHFSAMKGAVFYFAEKITNLAERMLTNKDGVILYAKRRMTPPKKLASLGLGKRAKPAQLPKSHRPR